MSYFLSPKKVGFSFINKFFHGAALHWVLVGFFSSFQTEVGLSDLS